MSELSLTDNLVNTNHSGSQTPNSADCSSEDSKAVWQAALDKAPPNSNLIINYLPPLLTEDELHNLFSPYGMILYHKIIKDIEHDRSLGYGFVLFSTTEAAQKAVKAMNGYVIDDKTLKVSVARPASNDLKRSNLYITNMPLTWSKEDMINFFKPFGEVVEARILHDPVTHQFRGVGFCRLHSHQAALNAISQVNDTVPHDGTEKLQVKLADIPSRYKNNRRQHGGHHHSHNHHHHNGPHPHHHHHHHHQSNYPHVHPHQHQMPQHMAQHPHQHQGVPALPHAHARGPRYQVGTTPHHGYLQQQQQQQPIPSHYMSQYPYQASSAGPNISGNLFSSQPVRQQSSLFPQQQPQQHAISSQYVASMMSGHSPSPNSRGGIPHSQPVQSSHLHNGVMSIQPSQSMQHPQNYPGPKPSTAGSGGGVINHQHPGICLFVYHLPLDASDQTLYQIFSPYATVLSTKVMKDPKTGRSRGFGFVNVLSEQDGKYAIAHLQNLRLGNKYIKISFKDNDESNTSQTGI